MDTGAVSAGHYLLAPARMLPLKQVSCRLHFNASPPAITV